MYNKTFEFNREELRIVEDALRAQVSKLANSRLTMIQSTIKPAHEIESVKEYDARIKELQNILGKIHNQKKWHHPKGTTYVSG